MINPSIASWVPSGLQGHPDIFGLPYALTDSACHRGQKSSTIQAGGPDRTCCIGSEIYYPVGSQGSRAVSTHRLQGQRFLSDGQVCDRPCHEPYACQAAFQRAGILGPSWSGSDPGSFRPVGRTLYNWKRAYREPGLSGLCPRSTVPRGDGTAHPRVAGGVCEPGQGAGTGTAVALAQAVPRLTSQAARQFFEKCFKLTPFHIEPVIAPTAAVNARGYLMPGSRTATSCTCEPIPRPRK